MEEVTRQEQMLHLIEQTPRHHHSLLHQQQQHEGMTTSAKSGMRCPWLLRNTVVLVNKINSINKTETWLCMDNSMNTDAQTIEISNAIDGMHDGTLANSTLLFVGIQTSIVAVIIVVENQMSGLTVELAPTLLRTAFDRMDADDRQEFEGPKRHRWCSCLNRQQEDHGQWTRRMSFVTASNVNVEPEH